MSTTEESVRLRLGRLTPAQRASLRSRLAASAAPALVRRDPQRPVLATSAQARMWFLQQYAPHACAYHSAYRLRLRGPLDVALLQRAWQAVVERHEVLRSGLAMRDGLLELTIAGCVDVALPLEDAADDEVGGRVLALARRPFDLSRPPLWRAALVRTADQVHELLLVLHHAITDRWSLAVLLRDLDQALAALTEGRAPAWPTLPLTYSDYAAWEHDWLQHPGCRAQVDFWREALRGAPQTLDLPIAAPRPAAQTWRGAVHRTSLPPAAAQHIVRWAAAHQATPYMVLLAGLAAVLARYTGRDDLVIGSPVSQRQRRELESLVGICLNTLPLRVRVPADASLTALVDDLRGRLPQALAHADVPLEALVERLQVARDPSRPPLVQVVFNLHNVPPLPTRLGPLGLTCHDVDLGVAKLDLTVTLRFEAAGLHMAVEHNVELFTADAVARLAQHFVALLTGALARPDTPVAELPLLQEAERRRIIEGFNAPAALPPVVPGLLEMFEEQARRTPHAPAVTDGTTTLTYAELDHRTLALAQRLRDHGAAPGARVGVRLPRSIGLVTAFVALARCGAAYVPLERGDPPARQHFIAEDCDAALVVTQAQADALHLTDRPCVAIDDGSELAAPGRLSPPAPDTPLYLIYTSGSTGRPKGVVVTHANVAGLVLPGSWEQVRHRPRFLFHTSASFDVSTLEIWLPLARGGTCVVYPHPRLEPSTLAEFVRAQRVDTAFITTSLFDALVDAAPASLEPLECLLIGGEAASPAHLARAASALPRTRLVNAYGPTETTVFATAWSVPAGYEATQPVLIGRPLPGRRVYVLDAHLQPLPVGVPGEVCVGGACVALGYHARPEQTASHFLPDPFGLPGSRIYRTGDLGRWTEAGEVEFLGRRDAQVKVRGHRIELGEIEAVLGQHAAVRQCAVLCSGEGDARMLVAYVVPADSGADVAVQCQSYLSQRLPEYMVPGRWACLPSLPLISSGKVDRGALAAAAPPEPAPGRDADADPADELERRLRGVWEDVLGVRPVGIRDSFFDLGGHSLLGVRLMHRAEEVAGRPLPLALLFQAPTVERLAAVLRQEGWSAPASLVAMQPSGHRPPLFCVPANMGNVHADLRGLALGLGQDQPLYGLQDLPGNPSRIGRLARLYVDQIRTVQARGPYLLCGICGGGVVAFEMARELVAGGERVALLALVEPSAPRAPGLRPLLERGAATLARVVSRTTHHADRLRLQGVGERWTYLRQKAKVLTNMLALVLYAPRPYAGAAHLLLSRESLRLPGSPRLRWARWARGGLTVHEVPGTHDSVTGGNETPVVTAHMRAVGEQLQACVDAALPT